MAAIAWIHADSARSGAGPELWVAPSVPRCPGGAGTPGARHPRRSSNVARAMHEAPADLAALQKLIDDSYARAGRHLADVHDPRRRGTAEEIAERLTGMRLLVLAAATADGRPRTGPVDGIFYRGAFHFTSAPDSVRFHHLRARPHVSATHLPGEELAVTVHGRAVEVDLKDPEHAGLRPTILDIYGSRHGPEWEELLDSGPVCARIEPERMFAFIMR